MEEGYLEGKVRSIGLANYKKPHILMILDDASVEKPHFNQFEINPFNLDEETIEFCFQNGVHLQGSNVFAKEDPRLV